MESGRMSKLITIPIRKHTKVRRLSRWTLYLDPLLDTGKFITRPITDISKGLENPLWCEHIFPSDWKMCYNKDNTTYYAPDGDWEELHKEMDNSTYVTPLPVTVTPAPAPSTPVTPPRTYDQAVNFCRGQGVPSDSSAWQLCINAYLNQ